MSQTITSSKRSKTATKRGINQLDFGKLKNVKPNLLLEGLKKPRTKTDSGRQNGNHNGTSHEWRGMIESEKRHSSGDILASAACKEPRITEEVKDVLNAATFGPSRVKSKTKPAAVEGTFTHENGGELRKLGSDVILRVPKGAVPNGKTYTIKGDTHTNLEEYERFLASESESFVGPIAEYSIANGGEFKKHVEIEIPIYITDDEQKKKIQVFRVENEDQEQITSDAKADVNFKVSGGVIIIRTVKFSVFFCKIHNTDETVPDNMMLTLHASNHSANGKKIVQLRTAIHFRCHQQNDFKGERAQIIGRNMEEVERKTFSFKNPSNDHPSEIHIKFNLHEGYGWEPWRENGEQLDNFENTIKGEAVMCTEKHKYPHSSIPLADFSVEHKDQQIASLTFHVVFKFAFPDGTAHEEKIKVVYKPDEERARTNDQSVSGEKGRNELLKKIVTFVSENITTEIEKLGTLLDVPDQKRFEAIRQGSDVTAFTRCHRLLTSWMESKGTGATPQVLIEALRGVERMDLAQKVDEIVKSDGTTTR